MPNKWYLKAQSGTGGGSGHTILDDDGYTLTQRSKMQFKGAYSEDNSTDGVTEVNVVRSMKKAEFDLLTDDEKKGIINVTDITSGSGDSFQPVIYSEEEREIGVWKNGQPVYAIVLTTSVAKSITTSSWTRMEFTKPIPANIKEMVRMSYACNTQPNFYEGFRLSWDNENHYFKMSCDHNGTFPDNTAIYIEYTKTTDQPGSGIWTPQGVPAIHYSENEVVVGTWINGKTLYGRTFVNENLSKAVVSSYDVYTIGTFDINAEMAFFITGALYETNDQRYFTLPYERSYSSTQKVYQELYTDASGKLYILASSIRSSGFNFSKAYITAYYTKIS